LVLEFEEIKHVVESGGRIKVRRVSGKPYLYPVYPMVVRGVLVG